MKSNIEMASNTTSLIKEPTCQRRVSIAMATYNGERFIKEQLDSLAKQTLLPIELIVTDDLSTDRTMEIVQSFSVTAPFTVKIFRNTSRLGYADNFLKAASLCNGELISFCDQDDVWLPDKLLICSREFEDENVMMCACDAYIIDEAGTRLAHTILNFSKIKQRKYPITTFPPFAIIPGFLQVFRKDVLYIFDHEKRCDDLYLPTCGAAHDAWITFVSNVCGSLSVISTPLALYRQHGQNASGDHSKELTLGQRLLRSLKLGSRLAIKMDTICQQRCGILKEAKYTHNLYLSAQLYTELSYLFHINESIYNNRTTSIKRTYKIIGIIFRGGYSQGKLGWRLLFKELSFAITKPVMDCEMVD